MFFNFIFKKKYDHPLQIFHRLIFFNVKKKYIYIYEREDLSI